MQVFVVGKKIWALEKEFMVLKRKRTAIGVTDFFCVKCTWSYTPWYSALWLCLIAPITVSSSFQKWKSTICTAVKTSRRSLEVNFRTCKCTWSQIKHSLTGRE